MDSLALANVLAFGDWKFDLNPFQPPPPQVQQAMQQAGQGAQQFISSIDPTTPEGMKKLASIFPFPLNALILNSGDLVKCQHSSPDPTTQFQCIGKFLLGVLKDVILTPEFQIAVCVASGNFPGAIVLGGKMVSRKIVQGISSPQIASQFGISPADIAIVSTVVEVLTASAEVVLLLASKGANAFNSPGTFHIIGGVLSSNATSAGSALSDIGLAIGYNATLLAALARSDMKTAQVEFDKLNTNPPKDINSAKGLAASVNVLNGLGGLVESIGKGFAAIPGLLVIGNGLGLAGVALIALSRSLARVLHGAGSIVEVKSQRSPSGLLYAVGAAAAVAALAIGGHK